MGVAKWGSGPAAQCLSRVAKLGSAQPSVPERWGVNGRRDDLGEGYHVVSCGLAPSSRDPPFMG